MELKVWCEGIPRVVCGASATTTCQDVVFALAHATGQVGRFILIEKWRHCERVLAPNDRPLASLLKFGEYAADVTFVMKKSGEVSTASSNSNSAQNNGGKPQLQSVMSTSKSAGALSAYQNNNSNYSATLPHRGHRPEPFVRSISFHKPTELQLANGGEVILTSSTSHHPNHHHHQHTYSMSRSGVNYVPVSGETRSIIDAQQQTIKKQEKDMVTIDQELNAVQRRLSANERVVAQYRAEMDYLHEIWLDQEALLGRLEAENLEEELERLITEAKAYEDELAEVRSRLSTCEADIARSREQISSLMVQVDEAAKAKDKERKKEEDKSENEQQQQAKLYSSLQKSILEKTKEIESQKLDLNLLCASIERLDQTIQDKNGIIDQLVVEIKDANVEGLSLSGALKGSSAGDGLTVRLDESHPQNQKSQQSSNHQMLMQNPMNSTTSASSSSTRKISVLPSELGNTVPTKKNPDGIWV
ncbi:Ras association domain-containing protein 8 [Tyrophagus putrescentiae]|nr:Ras association domain-containing protein 8 [Tyrophagus putrescentiae]